MNQPSVEALSFEQTARARHAQVVPSFVVPVLAKTLKCWAGTVKPGELVRWDRPGDLAESAKRDLRKAIITRLRPRSAWMWAQPTEVHLVDGWRDQLGADDARRIEAVVTMFPAKPLQQLTFGEFRQGFGGTLERLLAVLARLEAIYWEAPRLPAQRWRPHMAVAPQTFRPASAVEVQELARRVFALPWLSTVSQKDLRFGYPGPGSLPEWLQAQLLEEDISEFAVSLLYSLDEAATLTAADEAQALVIAAFREGFPRMRTEAATRHCAMFLARHISEQGAGHSLVEVGDEYDHTHSRVRQVCQAFEGVFHRFEVVTPALDRVLAAVARMVPCSCDEANEQLASFIGQGAGIECLIHWAQVLGHKEIPVNCHRVLRRLRGQMVDTTVVQRAAASLWVKPLIEHVRRDTVMFGCTNVLRVAGLLALKEGLLPGQDAIEAVLEDISLFRWLDKKTGWFSLGTTERSAAAARVRKIMAVAQDHVGVDEIAAALATCDMLYRKSQSLGLAAPPPHVLRELFCSWPWLKVVQQGRFTAGDGFDPVNVLSEAERIACQVIEQHDGIACHFELREAIETKLHHSSVAVSVMLARSPIFDRLEHGLYRLRGRRIGDTAVNSARNRMRVRGALHRGRSAPDTKPNEFVIHVTEAALREEQYSVPKQLRQKLAGKRIAVRDEDGRPLGDARVTPLGVLKGLNGLISPGAGDLLRVQLSTVVALLVRRVPAQIG